MNSNLGATSLKRRRRSDDPMRLFDTLPPELRVWLSTAALPWSPRSCVKIWRKARREGLSPTQAMARLTQIEQRALQRDSMQIKASL
ncbi:DUF6525 family protein [Roseovarius sp. 2305UL8-3]|uniref:DUF6525 family protein n=1 Tax=Roseovarius conchicola TaxID=3121636 RepID=UPI003526D093